PCTSNRFGRSYPVAWSRVRLGINSSRSGGRRRSAPCEVTTLRSRALRNSDGFHQNCKGGEHEISRHKMGGSTLDVSTVMERVDACVAEWMAAERTPAIQLAVTDRAGLLTQRAYGFAE